MSQMMNSMNWLMACGHALRSLNGGCWKRSHPKSVSRLEEILIGYRSELNNYQTYKRQLEEFYAAEEEEDDGFADEFAEQFGEVDTIELQVKRLGGVLEVAQRRIDWLESLKGDPDARARLSESTGIDLTIEALDAIIAATKQEMLFFEAQIKLLLEGTEASLDPFLDAESATRPLAQNVPHDPALLLSGAGDFLSVSSE